MFGKMKFEKIVEPGQIGNVKTKNRMVKPAQSMHFSTDDGYVSDTNLAHYEAIAKSGVGLILVEMAAVDYPVGHPSLKDLRIDEDRFVPSLAGLAKLIHSFDVPTFLQLTHCGPSHDPIENTQPKSSSTMSLKELPRTTYGPTTGLTIAEIDELVAKFAKGAVRAKAAGFDGIELHGAHAYLINSFLSNAWNKRTDKYGGSLENRARFASEVIRAIKAAAGADFPVGIRVNGAEYGVEGGLTNKETQVLCQLLEAAGANYFHVSAYGFGVFYNRIVNPEQIFYPKAPEPLGEGLDGSRKGRGALTLLAAGVKKAVSVPVIAVGRLDPILAEKILREGRADYVALGRCLMADSQAALKVLEGRAEDIAPCTACLMCIDNYFAGRRVVCRVNAALGREGEYIVKPAVKKKKVVVVGGGPAGMEAARVSALKGHEVTLYEKEWKLGGSMPIVALIKGLDVEDLVALIRYFRIQLKKRGVTVRLGKAADEALIKADKPDVVILATGGKPAIPQIPGIDLPIVLNQASLHRRVKPFLRMFGPRFLRWLTKFYLPVGKRVVIIGGKMEGIELAEFLVKRGRKVTVTETSDELGTGLVVVTKARLIPWLTEQGCTFLSGVKYEEITNKGVTLVTKGGERKTIEADTVATALPLSANTAFYESLKGKVPELYVIGDAREPHLILEAVGEGFRTALNI